MSPLLKQILDLAIQDKAPLEILVKDKIGGGILYVSRHDDEWIECSYFDHMQPLYLIPVSGIVRVQRHVNAG